MNSTKTRKNVTLADVARAAGISKTTASHALSGKGWVKPATRETVMRMAQEMDFEVDQLAQLLSNGRNEKSIGFYTVDLDLSGRTRQLQIIQSELNDLGYNVPVYAYGYRGNTLPAQLELMNTMLSQRPRAVVCNISGVLPPVLERLEKFVDDGGAAVCYGYSESAPIQCDQVVYAQDESFYAAARHLLELGHRKIGLFSVGNRIPCGATLDGFRRALEQSGEMVREEWLFPNDGTRRYEEDGALLAERFLALSERPTAMIIANDYAAATFLMQVTRAGIRVPEELSVVGHDDDAVAPYAVVPLTSVSIQINELSQFVIRLLNERLTSKRVIPPRTIQIAGSVVIRSSTAPFHQEGRSTLAATP